jgi:hypothetical protein
MYLGVNVAAPDGQPLLRESAFLALSRLPWFRYGRFPEWLRVSLLGCLSEEQRSRVRQALQALLVSGGTGSLNGYKLDFQTTHWRSLNWLTREFIWRNRPAGGADDNPLADAIFLRFLSGANPASLPLPERIANRIRGKPDLWAASSHNVSAVIRNFASSPREASALRPNGPFRPADDMEFHNSGRARAGHGQLLAAGRVLGRTDTIGTGPSF